MQPVLDYQFIQSIYDQIADIPTESIISKTLLTAENVKVIIFGFAPGQELSEHTAARAATLQFISGQASLTLGDQHHSAQPGTWVHLSPHLPHSVSAITEVIMLLVLH